MKIEILAPEQDSSVYFQPLEHSMRTRAALDDHFRRSAGGSRTQGVNDPFASSKSVEALRSLGVARARHVLLVDGIVQKRGLGFRRPFVCRFRIASRSDQQRAADHGIPYSDVVVDPLVMPVGAINRAGRQVMHIIRRLREELKVNSTCGASNISFGLPNRPGINSAFITIAMGAGMTSAITNPVEPELMSAILGADVMMGHDPDCRRWIRKYRAPAAADAEPRRRRRRRRDA